MLHLYRRQSFTSGLQKAYGSVFKPERREPRFWNYYKSAAIEDSVHPRDPEWIASRSRLAQGLCRRRSHKPFLNLSSRFCLELARNRSPVRSPGFGRTLQAAVEMVSGAVTSAGSATSYTSLMNFARVGAVVLGYLAGSSMAAERGREVRKKLEHELQQKEAELQRLRHEQAAVGGKINSTGDPVQDWLQSLPSS